MLGGYFFSRRAFPVAGRTTKVRQIIANDCKYC
jgi:hypothetical protein